MCTHAYVEADFRSEGRNARPQLTVCHDENKLKETLERLNKNPQVMAVRVYPCAQTISKETKLVAESHPIQGLMV